MPCYSPITGYRSRHLSRNGKRPIVFSPAEGFADRPVEVPCGRCTGCRLEYSRQWAVRCMHEAQCHKHNAFITLTYAPEHLPANYSVSKDEVQRFLKRLRKRIGQNIKFFACGEYGEKTQRPHYHAIIFGYDFPDKTLHAKNNGNLLYRSATLEKAWPFGHSLIGDVTFQSAAYVARYVMKKRKGKPDAVDPKTGKTNAEYYMLAHPETGEVFEVEPEFCLMSRGSGRPCDSTLWRYGIGRAWMEKYKGDLDKDFLTLNGNKMKLPKYYDNVLEAEDEIEMMYRKDKRRKEAHKRKHDNTLERLAVKEKVKLAQIGLLKRDLEEI